MNFNLGNATKYIWRAGRKDDAILDLQKALFYIADEIRRLNGIPHMIERDSVLSYIQELTQEPEPGMVSDYLFSKDLIEYIATDMEPRK